MCKWCSLARDLSGLFYVMCRPCWRRAKRRNKVKGALAPTPEHKIEKSSVQLPQTKINYLKEQRWRRSPNERF